MSQLYDTTRFLRRGFHLTTSKTLRRWVIIPLLFNIVLFSLLYGVGIHYSNLWFNHLADGWQISGLFSFLNALIPYLIGALKLLVWILLFVIFASVFTLAVQLVASPFLGLLAEKVNRTTSPLPLPEESLMAMTRRTLLRETAKLWAWLWRAFFVLIAVLICYLIPGLNLLASAIWFLFCGWMMALTYIDYGADCRQKSLKELNRAMHQNRWLVLGFGCIMLGLTMLPLINLFIMPVGVVTGTLLWNERLSHDRLPASKDITL